MESCKGPSSLSCMWQDSAGPGVGVLSKDLGCIWQEYNGLAETLLNLKFSADSVA